MAIGPCNVKGCELRAISGDKCLKHGPKKNTIVKKMCNSVGCGKEVVYYGKCEDHRTQSRKKCEVEGCTTGAVSKGLCIKHGGGKRCKIPTCDKGAEKGGLCKKHGGGNRCKIPGCTKSGQDSRTLLCVEHGGRKCAFEGCTKSNQGSGFCLEHGGGRKCAVEGCKHHSLHGGLCRAHGGGVVCSNKGCEEPVRSKGLCFNHGGGIRCKTNKCINRARDSSGYCHRHRRIHLEVQELQQELKLNSEQEVNDGCLTALLLTAAVAEPQNRRHASEIQTSKRHNSSENIAIV